jgi:hypothetical protein
MKLDEILSGIGGVFGRVVDDVTPSCHCGSKAIPRKCFICGGFACGEHAYINMVQITTGGPEAVICAECATQRPIPKGQKKRASNWYWTELGLDSRTAVTRDVELRFRELSKTHHPDHGGDETKFKRIATARGLALAELKARGR